MPTSATVKVGVTPVPTAGTALATPVPDKAHPVLLIDAQAMAAYCRPGPTVMVDGVAVR